MVQPLAVYKARSVQMTSLRSAGQKFSKVASHLMRGGTCQRAASRRVLSDKTHMAVPSAAGPTQKTTRDMLIPRMKSLELLPKPISVDIQEKGTGKNFSLMSVPFQFSGCSLRPLRFAVFSPPGSHWLI